MTGKLPDSNCVRIHYIPCTNRKQYVVIRSVNCGWVCNFVHNDDVLSNILKVEGTESSPGHGVSYEYIFSDYLLKILITRICQYINFTLCILCGLYGKTALLQCATLCCLRQKRLC